MPKRVSTGGPPQTPPRSNERKRTSATPSTPEGSQPSGHMGDFAEPRTPGPTVKTPKIQFQAPEPPRKRQRMAKSNDALGHIQTAQVTPVESAHGLALHAYTLPSGRVFYVLDEPLGKKGSFSRVYLAVDVDGALYALKALRPRGLPSPTGQRVTLSLKKIDHAYAMQERFEGPAERFRVGADLFISGVLHAGDVDELRLRLPPEHCEAAALVMLQDLLPKLAYMHAQNIGHGDLNLGNVCVDGHGHFHAVDLANADTFQSGLDDETGDFNRMPPEQRTQGEFHHGTDIWALGLMVWELATGATNPLLGKLEAWVAWHQNAPRDDQGRIDVKALPPSEEFGALLEALPERYRDWVVNDLLHPDPSLRVTAQGLLGRLPVPGAAFVDACAQTAVQLPTYLKGQALLHWLRQRT